MIFFLFNLTATTDIYTLSLHDALPIYPDQVVHRTEMKEPAQHQDAHPGGVGKLRYGSHCHAQVQQRIMRLMLDRKSTRLNSSHANISYAVFCLKKKNTASKCKRYNNNC